MANKNKYINKNKETSKSLKWKKRNKYTNLELSENFKLFIFAGKSSMASSESDSSKASMILFKSGSERNIQTIYIYTYSIHTHTNIQIYIIFFLFL